MKISEVSEMYGVSTDTLRYYEKIGLLDPVNKNPAGIRDYQEQDLVRIHFIKCMRDAGLSIELLKKYVELFHAGEDTTQQRKQMLMQQKEILQTKIDALENTMKYLNYKIDTYDTILLKQEKKVLKSIV